MEAVIKEYLGQIKIGRKQAYKNLGDHPCNEQALLGLPASNNTLYISPNTGYDCPSVVVTNGG